MNKLVLSILMTAPLTRRSVRVEMRRRIAFDTISALWQIQHAPNPSG
jgi:hypothetical protein